MTTNQETILKIPTRFVSKFKCLFGGCDKCPHEVIETEEYIKTDKRCIACNGDGKVENDFGDDCECCGGTGEHCFEADCGEGADVPCSACDGTGNIKKLVECERCHGTGWRLEPKAPMKLR